MNSTKPLNEQEIFEISILIESPTSNDAVRNRNDVIRRLLNEINRLNRIISPIIVPDDLEQDIPF